MKKILKRLSLLVLILVIGLVLTGCNNEEKNDHVFVDRIQENGIKFNMSRMSSNIGDSITITALFTPTNLVHQEVSWYVGWSQTTTATLSEYISYSISSDTKTLTVKFLKPFATEISCEAEAEYYDGYLATCDLGCYKRTVGIYELTINNGKSLNYSQGNDSVIYSGATYGTIFDTESAEIYLNEVLLDKIGTVDTISTYTCSIGLSSQLESKFDEKSYTYNNALSFTSSAKTVKGLLCDLIPNFLTNFSLYFDLLSETDVWFTIYITSIDKYNGSTIKTETFTIDVEGFDVSDTSSVIESINLDKTVYIF